MSKLANLITQIAYTHELKGARGRETALEIIIDEHPDVAKTLQDVIRVSLEVEELRDQYRKFQTSRKPLNLKIEEYWEVINQLDSEDAAAASILNEVLQGEPRANSDEIFNNVIHDFYNNRHNLDKYIPASHDWHVAKDATIYVVARNNLMNNSDIMTKEDLGIEDIAKLEMYYINQDTVNTLEGTYKISTETHELFTGKNFEEELANIEGEARFEINK